MKRLGFFSGNVYDYAERDTEECCMLISEDQANDENYIKKKHYVLKLECNGCGGCPMSREAAGIKYSPYAEISGMNIEVVLKEIIPVAHTAGFMEAKGQLDIESDIELINFIVNHFVKWHGTDRNIGFEEYICEKLIAKWKPDNE